MSSGAVFLRTRDALHREIDRAFREQGVAIAFPQRDVHLASATPVPVQIVSGTPVTQ
jgi:small-conductance mechanosensitive channel